MAGGNTPDDLARALLEQYSDPRVAFRRPMPDGTERPAVKLVRAYTRDLQDARYMALLAKNPGLSTI